MMAHKKRSGPEDALDKAMGVVGEAVGRVGGDESLEAEGRVLRRKGDLKTYLVKPHADGGWKVQAEAVAAAKELARSKTPSQLLVYKADGFEVQEEKTYE
jgi:uncharacterized protein YjbJ (UPF0337 family)